MKTAQRDETIPVTGVTMGAIVQDEYGPSPEDVLHLARVGRPPIGAGEVLVRVRAASVDRGTWHIMAGLPYPIRVAGFGLRRPKHLNPGRSLAGTVEAVGSDAATGRLVIVGGETNGRWLGGADRQVRAQVLSLFVGHKLGTFIASENAEDLVALRRLIEAGDVKPVLDRVYPLSDTASAIRHLIQGQARGKIVITIPPPTQG